jgi:hypothetical protein
MAEREESTPLLSPLIQNAFSNAFNFCTIKTTLEHQPKDYQNQPFERFGGQLQTLAPARFVQARIFRA